jgi:hypothetical protein
MLEAAPTGNEEIADWIELAILASGQKGNTTHKIQKWANDWANLSELQVASGLKTMERRSALLGSKYPFAVNEFAVVFDQQPLESSLYIYLLLMTRPTSSVSWQSAVPTQDESDLFEEVVALALKDYLGESAEAIPFGWPSKFGRPQEFPLAIDWLADKLGLKLGKAFRPPRRKDGGVDVVAWKPFNDRRSGFPIYLVQCTLQKEFVSKSRDIDLRIWAGWLEMDHDPVSILAVPRSIAPGEAWNEITANSIIFERFRLTESINQSIPEAHRDYISKLVSDFRKFAESHLE